MFVVTVNLTQLERTHIYTAVNTTPGTVLSKFSRQLHKIQVLFSHLTGVETEAEKFN